jgi:hypothetical protein
MRKGVAMKRIAMGFVWLVVLYFGILGIGGALLGGSAGSEGKNFDQGYQAGHAIGVGFGKQYGTLVLIVAISGAVLGTMSGLLPGTKRKA